MKWLPLAGLALALWATPARADEDHGYTATDTLQAIDQAAESTGVSRAWITRVVICESNLDPYAIGRQGELGAAQLHPRGLLPLFRREYGADADPFNPYLSVAFLAEQFAAGHARAWSCR